MALPAGTRFGAYEITGELGAGGMGEVYRATDTSLKRDVAIKVLPESFADDADRLARFQREAEVLASLNHANIAQIYGLEKSDGQTVIVMELVEGPTLADRIAQGPIPPDEALAIARQVADALEAAHAKQVVHRDLKPANIKLRPDGTIKVLDFGIAKAIGPEAISGGRTPVMTTPAVTETGVILGTAAYMSPEQARGRPVDERTDIWAFGCLLFEMLTGQPAFGGEDVMLTLARVLDRDTDLSSMPGTISPAVRHTIKLCLEKDPANRISDIRDVRLALQGRFEPDLAAGAPAAKAAPLRSRLVLPVAVTAVAAVLVTALATWFATRPEPSPVNRFAYTLPRGQVLRLTQATVMALSPGGREFAYNTGAGLYVRSLGELEARIVPGTEGFMAAPFFSADGQSVGYYTESGLRRIAIGGGASVLISEHSSLPRQVGASWTSDDVILFGDRDGIFRVPASGGTAELVIESRDGEQLYGPELLPDGDSVLLTARTPSPDEGDIVAVSLSTGKRTVLVKGGADARYVPTGHLVYALGDSLFAVRFDAKTLRVSGGPVPLVQGVMRASLTPAANYAISKNGTLVYVSGQVAAPGHEIVWVDRDGNEEPIDAPPRNYQYVQLSPDGTRLALDARDQENDIWIWDLERETLQRLTFDPGVNRVPVWAPNGRRVAFSRALDEGEEIYWQAADGSGVPEALTEGSIAPMVPNDISPDGKVLLYMPVNRPRDIWMTGIGEAATEPTRLIAGPADEKGAQISPDGRWLAYESDESGQSEVYVRPFPDVDTGRWQISTAGGTRPRWSRDGKELFYFVEQSPQSGALMAVSVESEPGFQASAPHMLFEGGYLAPNASRQTYDVSLDGQRFLMIKAADDEPEASETRIIIVENWFGELERLAPAE